MELTNNLKQHINNILIKDGRTFITVGAEAFKPYNLEVAGKATFKLDKENFKALDAELKAAGVTYKTTAVHGEYIPVWPEQQEG